MSISKGLLVAAFSLVLNIIWAYSIPPLNARDEPAHLMAVLEIRKLGRLPQIHIDFQEDPNGQPIKPYLDASVVDYARSLNLAMGCCTVPYESMQPPLYYAIVAAVSVPFPDNAQSMLYIGRLVSAIMGAATIYYIWAAVRQLVPGAPLLALLCAAVVTLLPQFASGSASVNNDSLLSLVGAASFYVWFRGLRDTQFDPYLMKAGALLGLGFLTKLTALTLIPALALVIFFRTRDASTSHALGTGMRPSIRSALPLVGGVVSTVVLVAGWLVVRNLVEYGEWTGGADALKWYSLNYDHADLLYLQLLGRFIAASFASTIGVFGATVILLPTPAYLFALIAVAILSALSILTLGRNHRLAGTFPASSLRPLVVFLLAALAVLAAFVQFNVTVSLQPQGRYLFLLLLPFSMLISLGIYKLSTTTQHSRFLLMLPLLWLGITNLVGLYTVLGKWDPG